MAKTRIDVAVANVHDAAANAAMRMLYVITQGGNDDADALIVASLQDGGKVPSRHVMGLSQYAVISKLIESDGTIYEPLRAAIRQAVKEHFLAITSPNRHYRMHGPGPQLG